MPRCRRRAGRRGSGCTPTPPGTARRRSGCSASRRSASTLPLRSPAGRRTSSRRRSSPRAGAQRCCRPRTSGPRIRRGRRSRRSRWSRSSAPTSGPATPRARWVPAPTRPLAGLRVLDLTRVLAGPVATRLLAGLGADVLRIDPPDWDEPGVVPDMTIGKRLARLDARDPADLARLRTLLAGADVLVHGYRSDALDRLGLPDAVRRELRPGLVDVSLDAYGHTGPWAPAAASTASCRCRRASPAPALRSGSRRPPDAAAGAGTRPCHRLPDGRGGPGGPRRAGPRRAAACAPGCRSPGPQPNWCMASRCRRDRSSRVRPAARRRGPTR